MPSSAVKLVPGVNTDRTPSLNETGISASNLIRFREGLVEKRGGWTRYLAAALSPVPRALWPYRDFLGQVFLAIGSTNGLAVANAGVLTDITPRVLVSRLAPSAFSSPFGQGGGAGLVGVNDPSFTSTAKTNIAFQDIFSYDGITISGPYTATPFATASTTYFFAAAGIVSSGPGTGLAFPTYSTTQGSPTVNVQLNGHGLTAAGNAATPYKFALTNPVSVGGITLVGAQTVSTVVDANNFTVQFDGVATATASVTPGNGTVAVTYNVAPMYGQAVQGTKLVAQDWSLGNYGKLLIACAAGGSIYQWDSTGAYITAGVVANSPQASGILISDAAQQIVAYGGNPATLFDPNYVAWSDTGNPTQWAAAIGNQAGSYRIPTGSAIIGAATVAQTLILLWTDVDVWAMQYVGYPTVYGFTKIATGCGLVGQFAWARMGGLTYWMSQNKFWVFDGQSVQPLACPVFDSVFPRISKLNVWKIRGGSNAAFGEVMWFFPSTSGTGENDTYVCYNPGEGTWDVGTMPRSAWCDQSVAGLPIGADPQGDVFQHETSPDAAGQPLSWSFTTGLFQIDEGEGLAFLDRIRPDFRFPQGAGTVQVSVLTYKYPGDAPVTRGPYSFTQATEYITTRCRGRYVAFQFSGSDLGSFWRIGRTQYRYQVDGRR